MTGRWPHRSWRGGPERVRQRAEQLGLGTGGGESEADAARGLCDAGGDLQQAQPKRGELRLGEVARFGTAEWLYDGLYCARGQAENLIKLHA